MKLNQLKPLATSITGLFLLVPAAYFLLALSIRILFGSTAIYYDIAPSFLQAASEIFSFQKSGWILYGPLLAIFLNLLSVFKLKIEKKSGKTELVIYHHRYWLNTAVILQSLLFVIILTAYLIVEHYRY